MMIRGDQHVDDWAEMAVDYLDGQLDQEARLAVEAHLAGCPECAARLRRQKYVVTVLQETVLDEPPENLEYRSVGELIFPSPGAQPVIRPLEEKKIYRTPRWVRTLRAWLPATVAVIALLVAVTAYGIVRSGSGGDVATDSARLLSTTIAAGSTTTAGAAALSEAAPSASEKTMPTAGATTTTLLTGMAPSDTQVMTFSATEDPKAMIRALESAQAPTFVAFRAAAADQGDNQGGTGETTDTTVGGTETTSAPATTDTSISAQTTQSAPGTLSREQADALLNELKQFTGLDPVETTYWIDGPTFAVYLPREDAAELIDLVRSISVPFGLSVSVEGAPPSQSQEIWARLLEQKPSFPVLEARRALQPSTWNYDFTTSTLGDGTRSASELPDADGSHVIVVIWIAE